ncbi:MAG: MFS transporter [Candidatus Lokiarchaeota archaeon]|nr:MFS transporter [Candidatus Lokiarchaeota archaeon]
MKSRNFIPVYLLEITITFIVGVTSTAISNHLIRDLSYPAWIASIITAVFFVGFFTATITIGNISDKIEQDKLLKIILTSKIVLNGLYLIPILSDFYLIFFGALMFLDGALNGLFWPTVQNFSVLAEKKGGSMLKKKFLAGYNLSWNLGFLCGSISGTVFVYITNSNYQALYLGFIGAIVGTAIAWRFAPRTIKLLKTIASTDTKLQSTTTKPESLEDLKIFDNQTDKKNQKHIQRLIDHPIKLVMAVLLTHSLIDGALLIILPLKVLLGDHWIFFLALLKLLSQTISTTSFSYLKDKITLRYTLIAIIFLLSSWFFILFTANVLFMALLLIISGFGQGIIYTLNMKIMSYKAQTLDTSRPFALFQSMMSTGRILGPIIIGVGALINVNVGVLLLVLYDLTILLIFIYFTYFQDNSTSE